MVGMSTVLEYPYPQRASPDRFSLGQVDYFNGHEGSLGLAEVTNLVGFNQDLPERRFGLTLAAKDTFVRISGTVPDRGHDEPVVAGVGSVLGCDRRGVTNLTAVLARQSRRIYTRRGHQAGAALPTPPPGERSRFRRSTRP